MYKKTGLEDNFAAPNASETPALGTGIYTYAEAAHLLRTSARSVRQWAEGYTYAWKGEPRLVRPVLQRLPGKPRVITFLDLMELFLVKQYRDAGVRLQEIRQASQYLAQEFRTPYPLAFKRLLTDGKQLLMKVGDQYRNVVSQQQVFKFVEHFFKDVDFNEEELAERWWPLGHKHAVVIDPHWAFGAPIVAHYGTRTDVLYATYVAEGENLRAVADWYGVSVESVQDAVEFERKWIQAA